jgi:hypothetical protein
MVKEIYLIQSIDNSKNSKNILHQLIITDKSLIDEEIEDLEKFGLIVEGVYSIEYDSKNYCIKDIYKMYFCESKDCEPSWTYDLEMDYFFIEIEFGINGSKYEIIAKGKDFSESVKEYWVIIKKYM